VKAWRAVLWVILGVGLFVGLMVLLIHTVNIPVLEPQGSIGHKQRNLIYFALALSLIVVIPVYTMLILFASRYREEKKNTYEPTWDHNNKLEVTWWLIPAALITILSIVTWNSSHSLDPYRPISSPNQPLQVQVVALQWRWLFLYPEQGVASINHLQLPANRPINFTVTSEGPMNSFWIPQLGGQIYAMSGMVSQLHLEADKPGDYFGVSANISGSGFATMKFLTRVGSQDAFDDWIDQARQSNRQLDFASYQQLAKPNRDSRVALFASTQDNLFEDIRMNSMGHSHSIGQTAAAGREAYDL